jgi:hypothetical protein
MEEKADQVDICTVKTYTRIPRKKKKQIPVGFYCYTQKSGFKYFKDGSYGYEIKTCHFYGHVKYKNIPKDELPNWVDEEYLEEFGDKTSSWCSLIKSDIMDQCKSCGIKYGKLR